MTTITWNTGVSGDWTTSSDWVPAQVPGSSDDAQFNGFGFETITVSTSIAVNSITIGNVVASVAVTGTLTVGSGPDDVEGNLSANGGKISFTSPGTLTNNGNITANSGSIFIGGSLAGTGIVSLQNGGTIEFGGSVNQNQSIIIQGSDQLTLDQPQSFAGTITNFIVGDVLQLGTAVTAVSYANNDLKLRINDTAQTLDLAVVGTYSLSNFTLAVSGETTTINVAGTNSSPPGLGAAGNSVNYISGSSGVTIDPTITIVPNGATTFAGATISITGGGLTGDILATNTTGVAILQTYDAATETLTLSGRDTLSDYQHILQFVTFVSTSADATNGGANDTRTVSWVLTDGLSNSTAVTSTIDVQPACFVEGTRIATERGAVAVEDLREGDRVLLESGDDPAPVVWIGRRHVACARHPKPRQVWPVRIAADAFGPGRPCRDLWLSPDHALFVGNVLIPVMHLINGVSIARVPVDAVTYYHVELPRHDVLLAEGLPCESYLDIDDRANFDNGGDAMRLYPDFSTPAVNLAAMWELKGCAPLVIRGPELEAARVLVNGRVAAAG